MWIVSFLSDRKINVKMGSTISDEFDLRLGTSRKLNLPADLLNHDYDFLSIPLF